MPFEKTNKLICTVCSTPYLVEKGRIETSRFCSILCRNVGMMGTGSPNWKPPKGTCAWCKAPFKKYKRQRELFCSRECYDANRKGLKRCKDCGHERCRACNKDRQKEWRALAPKQELKAKSMQVLYRQASGKTRTLTLDQARSLIADPPTCVYCELPIPWQELSIDHMQPICREGSNDDSNLTWVHKDCNLVKGSMNFQEFVDFLKFIKQHSGVQKYLFPRLKSGGGFIYRKR